MKKILIAILAATLLFSCTACSGAEYSYTKESDSMLHFSSSDPDMDHFLNDYLHRHLRYDDYEIGELPLGQSTLFNKEAEALSLFWFDSQNAVPDDRYAMMENYFRRFPVDRFGYVWSAPGDEPQPGLGQTATHFSQGWPFPDYTHSAGRSKGWEFNTNGDTEGWEVSGADSAVVSSGFYTIQSQGAEIIEIISPDFSDEPIETYHSPFLEVDLSFFDTKNIGTTDIDDIYIYWQTEGDETFTSEKCVSRADWATRANEGGITTNWRSHMFFPLYQHPEWGLDKNVTRIKIEIRAQEDKYFKGNFNLNFVRGNYDSRQANNNSIYLTTGKLDYQYTGNVEFLEENLSNYRRAMQFMLTHLQGEEGLLDQEYFVGHDGVNEIGHGIGTGYWDILSSPQVSFYANMFFYKALDAMEYLERAAEKEGIVQEMPEVDNPTNTGKIQYQETAESLNALKNEVKENLRKNVADGGFWDPEKGRFIEGVDAYGSIIDYGYTMYNLEAIELGIATEEQAESILSWINGDRIIESDTAKGKTGDGLNLGIYDFEFAPRTSTLINTYHYFWQGIGDTSFGASVQNGGAVMFVSYYDLLARISTRGADDAYARLKEIQTWYNKVEEYAKNAGVGEGLPNTQFYRVYYEALGIPMQGANTSGGIGLDIEFLESAMLYATVPFGFFGLEADLDTMNVAPELPSSLDWWKLENLAFHGVRYDLTIGDGFVEVDGVRGVTAGKSLNIKIDKPEGGFSVYVNGVSTNEYKEENGKIVVNVPFASCKIEVK